MKTNCSCTMPERVCERCNYRCDEDGNIAFFPISVLDDWDMVIDDDCVLLKKKVR